MAASLSYSSTEEINSLGNNIKSKSETIAKYLKDIEVINNDLEASWKGTAAALYCERLKEDVENLKIANEAIDSTGVYLQNVSNTYREAEDTNSTYTYIV